MIRQRIIEQNGKQKIDPQASEVPRSKLKLVEVSNRGKPSLLKLLAKERKMQGCEASGEGDIACAEFITIAHIITQQFKPLRVSASNRIMVCKMHQEYFNIEDQKLWFRFVKKRFPEKFRVIKDRYNLFATEYQALIEVVTEDNSMFSDWEQD